MQLLLWLASCLDRGVLWRLLAMGLLRQPVLVALYAILFDRQLWAAVAGE
jgi:hypothetical protein